MALTVLIISAGYSRIIEAFPHGGGGYVVATKLLGKRTGVVSGSALLVDYVLTITVSIAAAGDALFSLAPLSWHFLKLPFEVLAFAGLTTINIRGVKESVLALTPVFLLFLVTHAILIGWGILSHAPELSETVTSVRSGFEKGLVTLGLGGLLMRFVHAYSLGSGTYTGIEAVSNGLQILREPRDFLLDVLDVHPTPLVHELVAGQVERRVRIDVVDLVRFDRAHAGTSSPAVASDASESTAR